jgi:hypothetical protein
VIALVAAQNLVPIFLPDFHLVLARQFQRRLHRLRPARGEVNRSTRKPFSGKIEQLLRKLLCDWSRELAGVRELQLTSLLRHGVGNFANTMADEIHCRRSREIQVAVAVRIPNVSALAPHGHGISPAKRPPQHGREKLLLGRNRSSHTRIIRGSWGGGGMYGFCGGV